jgi:hypothetical protein
MVKQKSVAGIKPEQIDEIIKWKLHFNAKTKKPAGQGFFVCVAGLDEVLPPLTNSTPEWEEREAVMVILKKKK